MVPLVGGAISLALNIKAAEKGKVKYSTYLGLVAVSALGALRALLLSQPQQVVRSDGTEIPYMKETNFRVDVCAIWRQIRNKYMLLLIPVFVAGRFGVTGQSNYLTSKPYLTTSDSFSTTKSPRRSLLHRALPRPSLFLHSPGRHNRKPQHWHPARPTPILARNPFQNRLPNQCLHTNSLLDLVRRGPNRLTRASPLPNFDMGSGSFFNSALTVYTMFRFWYEVLQMYLYWLMAEIKDAHREGSVAWTRGILRSWESIDRTVAYAIGATHLSNQKHMIVGVVLRGAPVAVYAVGLVWGLECC